MASKMELVYGDETYILEYTRSAYAEIEQLGFSLTSIEDRPLSACYMLFYGALRKNHAALSQKASAELLDNLLDDGYELADIFQGLAEMMNEVFTSTGKAKKAKILRMKK